VAEDPVIRVGGLTKHYGGRPVVAGVDLEVRRGEVFCLLGPNGAGKTTTVEILEGYRARDGGDALVLGTDPGRGDRAWRARIGIVPQGVGQFAELTVAELVAHFAVFYPAPLAPAEVVELVDLEEQARTRAEKLSGGQRRRLDIALGVVGDPELLFLDEPSTGLDPQARRLTWALIERLSDRGVTVLLTTHYLDEAEALADRVGVLLDGKLVEVATPSELGGRSRAAALVSFAAEGPLAGRPLPELSGAEPDPHARHGHVGLRTERPTATVAALTAWAARAGLDELPELTVTRPTLEDTYLRMVAAAGADPAPLLEEARA
jgi:ABC-2 type transport system ATP-binding protein